MACLTCDFVSERRADSFNGTQEMLWSILLLFKETLLYADSSIFKVKLTQFRIIHLYNFL